MQKKTKGQRNDKSKGRKCGQKGKKRWDLDMLLLALPGGVLFQMSWHVNQLSMIIKYRQKRDVPNAFKYKYINILKQLSRSTDPSFKGHLFDGGNNSSIRLTRQLVDSMCR